jgi:hypothetical protein
MSVEKSLDEALDWFNDRISSTVASYRNNAMKQMRAVIDKIEELKTAAHRFDYSDIKDPDVYQNYATTIYNNTQETFEEIRGYGNPELELSDATAIIIRKSDYICSKTLMINSNKAAWEISREIIKLMRNSKTKMKVTISV